MGPAVTYERRRPETTTLYQVVSENLEIVLQPQVTYKRGPLTLFLGGLFLDGKAGSFGAYYQQNTELYMKAKVAF